MRPQARRRCCTTELEQLWLIPAHKNLIGANIELVDAERREYRLRDALAPLRERFQFIVLDCPPALDLLTLNALVAADAVLIPMQAEYFALGRHQRAARHDRAHPRRVES